METGFTGSTSTAEMQEEIGDQEQMRYIYSYEPWVKCLISIQVRQVSLEQEQLNQHRLIMGAQTKTAVVTGGASGIGLAIVEYFVSEGYNVAVCDINIDAGNKLVSRLAMETPQAKIIFKKCDVSSWKNQAIAFKEVYTEFGKIDIVVANAGISEQGGSSMASIEEDEPQEPSLKVLDVDLSGIIYCEPSSPLDTT